MSTTAVVANTDFLPKGYKIPSKSDQFLKLEQGKNKFRIMSPVVAGWVLFIKDEDRVKPVRNKEDVPFEKDFIEDNAARKEDQPKHFWAFVVWSYRNERFQALELTQASIKKSILSFFENEDYGDPRGYDITIDKTGEGLNTEYQVVPSPPKKLPTEIQDTFEVLEYNMDALFEGEYPFG